MILRGMTGSLQPLDLIVADHRHDRAKHLSSAYFHGLTSRASQLHDEVGKRAKLSLKYVPYWLALAVRLLEGQRRTETQPRRSHLAVRISWRSLKGVDTGETRNRVA